MGLGSGPPRSRTEAGRRRRARSAPIGGCPGSRWPGPRLDGVIAVRALDRILWTSVSGADVQPAASPATDSMPAAKVASDFRRNTRFLQGEIRPGPLPSWLPGTGNAGPAAPGSLAAAGRCQPESATSPPGTRRWGRPPFTPPTVGAASSTGLNLAFGRRVDRHRVVVPGQRSGDAYVSQRGGSHLRLDPRRQEGVDVGPVVE